MPKLEGKKTCKKVLSAFGFRRSISGLVMMKVSPRGRISSTFGRAFPVGVEDQDEAGY